MTARARTKGGFLVTAHLHGKVQDRAQTAHVDLADEEQQGATRQPSLTAAKLALDTGGAARDAIGSVINAGQMANAPKRPSRFAVSWTQSSLERSPLSTRRSTRSNWSSGGPVSASAAARWG